MRAWWLAVHLLPDMFSALMVRAVEFTLVSSLSHLGNGPLGAYAQDLLSRYKDIGTLGHYEGRWRSQLDHWVLGDPGALRSGDSVNVDTGTGVYGIPRGDKMRHRLPKLENSILQSFTQVVHVAKGDLVGIERDAELGLKENLGRAELEKLRLKTMNCLGGVREVAMQVANAQNQHPQGVYIMAGGTAVVISTVNCAVSMLQTLELGDGLQNYAQTGRCAQRMIQMHVQSLAMVKDVLAPGLVTTLEDAVISEELVQIHSAFGAGGRGVFRGAQQDPSAGGAQTPVSAETALGAGRGGRGKQMMMTVATAAFITMAIVAGISSLGKVYSLRISERLDQLQRGLKGLLSTLSCGAGSKESPSRNKKTPADVSLFLLRVLVGDCPVFGLQWVELRLLLNEQVVLEKLSMGATAGEVIQAADTEQCNASLTDCEKVFIQAVVLTRLLTRLEAATLYCEAVRFLGRALEEQLISNVKSTVSENLDHLREK
ncbi:hypothetical protein CBR_g34865 [Chara braunii]|uniref:Uncharacterized protein n=1 Tax=Chara braunii TaxID=69332 RepID=A0A388LJJ6_CHABU|nr:hypothetical protein CBR_g34865 [Chara braunii]|eukprot:GBG82489.1 hypothetical protein CBR_g34865 [Chara braunii]